MTRLFAPTMQKRFAPIFTRLGIVWPPPSIRLLAFKHEKRLEVWSTDRAGRNRRIRSYTILAASGKPGPKRREGDRQVPEGFYRITELNPNSLFHLSMRVNYPNQEDIAHATVPRAKLGNDIFIHGNKVSWGCLAMGDPAIEEIFTLVALAPASKRSIIISPIDFRTTTEVPTRGQAPWVLDLYGRIIKALKKYR